MEPHYAEQTSEVPINPIADKHKIEDLHFASIWQRKSLYVIPPARLEFFGVSHYDNEIRVVEKVEGLDRQKFVNPRSKLRRVSKAIEPKRDFSSDVGNSNFIWRDTNLAIFRDRLPLSEVCLQSRAPAERPIDHAPFIHFLTQQE